MHFTAESYEMKILRILKIFIFSSRMYLTSGCCKLL
nr:MAG TPA: hypothetical protein [Caudoviricetes sp.]